MKRMLIFAALLAAPAAAEPLIPLLQDPIDQTLFPCREAVRYARYDPGYLTRYMEEHQLPQKQRDELYLVCAGYNIGVSDARSGRVKIER